MKTTSIQERSRLTVVALAATRLAAIYALGVFVLAAPLIAIFGDLLPALTIPVVAILGFLLGFIALAAARRLGFGILWSLLAIWWVQIVGQGIFAVNGDLLFWTVFAVPLYLITSIGMTSASPRQLRLDMLITLTAWAAVVAIAVSGEIYIDVTPRVPAQWDNYVCAAWPLLVAGRELVRVVLGLRAIKRVEAAA